MNRSLVSVAGGSLSLLAMLLGGPAAPASVRSHSIVMTQMKFGPAPANVRAGDVIVWVNRDIVPHTATANNGSFDVTIPAGKSVRMVVRQPGSIPFYCRFHPAMRGALAVAAR